MQRKILEDLFDALPVGVVILDRQGKVIIYNRHEEMLAGRRRERVLGRAFFSEVAPCLDVRQLAGAFREKVEKGTLDERLEVELPLPDLEKPRAVLCRLKSFVADDEPCGMLLVEDISMEREIAQLKTTLAELLVHDLKSPLAVVLANVDLAARGLGRMEAVPDRLAAPLGAARIAGARLQAMIVDLLDIARMQSGTFPIARACINAAAVLREAVQGQCALAERAGRSLSIDVPELLECELDAKLLRRIVDNLIDNALRNSPRESTVAVRAGHCGAETLIDIVDQGPGVPVDLRERIFDPYMKVASRAAGAANRGLGLTFVQLAMRAHGGEVEVIPNYPTGAIFRMRFP